VAALVPYGLVVVLTLGVNEPLNDQIKAAGDPDRIANLAAVCERFDEARWGLARLILGDLEQEPGRPVDKALTTSPWAGRTGKEVKGEPAGQEGGDKGYSIALLQATEGE
jgi:hypothetical protein